MTIALLTFFACEEKPVEDSGFFDIVIEDSNADTEDTEEKEDTAVEESGPDSSALMLIGSYTDSSLVSHTITEDVWDSGPERVFNISQYDNNSGFLIAQNGENNNPQYGNPERWSKFQWYRNDDGELSYCQSISDASSEDAALTANADVADLSLGCAGRPWTEIRLNMDLSGDFVDSAGAPHSINAFTWAVGTAPSLFHIIESSNDDDYALAQNDDGNAFYPGLYSKFEWTTNPDGEWFYCQSTSDASSLDDAKGITADRDDLLTGCGMEPWTGLNGNSAR